MYDAQTRELYATLFKTASAALKDKHAQELAEVLVKLKQQETK
jgi:hypothetical protein